MLSTKQPVLRRFWYPVMPVSLLADGQLKPFRLLGENIVLWQRGDGTLACLKDRCCHRSAKLSLGYVEGGNVVCGYHGWTYSPTGACVRVPQLAEGTVPPASYGVKAYRVEARYGYVWVALDEPLTGIPEIAEASMAGFRHLDQFYEVWKIGALRLMENSFDAAHVSFVHRATFGNADRPESGSREIEPLEYGLIANSAFPVEVRDEVARKAIGVTGAKSERRLNSIWYMPFIRRTAISYPHGLIHVIITCATPIDDDNAMVVQWAYRNDSEADAPAEQVTAFDRAVTLEDRLILESTDSDVPLAIIDGEEKHMASDRPGVMMRRMLVKLLHDHGEVEQRRAI
jgi:phenylpropionate dioxygenase-like ring-hydroxylating dioxygenase large terminal subunit